MKHTYPKPQFYVYTCCSMASYLDFLAIITFEKYFLKGIKYQSNHSLNHRLFGGVTPTDTELCEH